MQYNQLECFVELCETLNFTETAENLHITQPAVTHQIQTLEKELGIKLFLRDRRKVALTPAGESFYHDMKDILTKTTVAIAKARNYASGFSSTLTVGYEGNSLELQALPIILQNFRAVCPEIYLYLKCLPYRERKQQLISNKLDIIFTIKENVKRSAEITYCELFKGHMVCVLPSQHPLSHNRVIDTGDLQDLSLILLDPLQCPPEMAHIQEKIQLLCPCITTYYCDSANICYTMIKGGIGIAVMPDFVTPKDSGLAIIPFSLPGELSYGLARLSSNKGQEILTFSNICHQIFSTLPHG